MIVLPRRLLGSDSQGASPRRSSEPRSTVYSRFIRHWRVKVTYSDPAEERSEIAKDMQGWKADDQRGGRRINAPMAKSCVDADPLRQSVLQPDRAVGPLPPARAGLVTSCATA